MDGPSITKTEALILSALLSGERYGLQIIDKAEEITNGKVTLSLGGLYTTLHRLEKKGLVKSRWGESTEVRRGARRKYYKLTGLGTKALNETTQVFNAVISYGLNPIYGGAL